LSSAPQPDQRVSQAEAFIRIRLLVWPIGGTVSQAQLLRWCGSGLATLELELAGTLVRHAEGRVSLESCV
jgi:hypothetical protein